MKTGPTQTESKKVLIAPARSRRAETRLFAAAGTPCRVVRNQGGVTYLGLMFLIVLMGITLSTVAQQWSFLLKRDREAELQFRGNRIKNAIEKFAADYEVKKTERDHALPRSLEELTKPTAYLPAAYKDPITGKEFEYLVNEDFIYGVRSRSKDKPLNKVVFQEAKTYHDIVYKAQGAATQNCSRSGLNSKGGGNQFAPSSLDQNAFISQSGKTGGTGADAQSGAGVCNRAGGMGGMGMGMGMPGMGMGMPGMGMGMPGMGMGMPGMGMGMPGMGMGMPGMGMGMPGTGTNLNGQPFQGANTDTAGSKPPQKKKHKKQDGDSDFETFTSNADEQPADSNASQVPGSSAQ